MVCQHSVYFFDVAHVRRRIACLLESSTILSLRVKKEGGISLNSSDKLRFSLHFKTLINCFKNILRENIVDYVQVIIYERPLTNMPSINTKIKVSVKRASMDDLKRIYVIRARNKNGLSKRLNDGHLCFIAERKGDPVGYCWVAFRELYIIEIDRKIKFDNAEACIYDVFVFPEYRRKKIYQKMLVEIFRFLKKKGYKKAFINVLSTNIPSQRGVEHVGFKRIKNVTFLKLFGLKKYAENGSVSKKEFTIARE